MPAVHSTEIAAIRRKVSWRILPFLLLCYAMAYLDRVNIGFAKLQLQADIGLSEFAYGIGAGIFFVGYVIFEVPSNLLLERVGARKTFSRIMILWGATSASMAFVQDAWSFYALRFLLGVFEAGFGPGLVFYLTCWYSRAALGRVLAAVLLAGPVGIAFGAPLSTAIMSAFDGSHGLAGWQWLFLIEGLPCVLLGIVAFYYLCDAPKDAAWLSDRERALLQDDIASERPPGEFASVLRNPRVYLLSIGYFCMISAMYGLGFWLPSILRDRGVTSLTSIGALVAIPYLAAIAFMLIAAFSSDRLGDRRWHSAILAVLAAAALAVATTGIEGTAWFFAITLAMGLLWASYAIFWTIPPEILGGGRAAAGGIALINSIGLIGGIVAPPILGWTKDRTQSFDSGIILIAALMGAAGLIIAIFGRTRRTAAG